MVMRKTNIGISRAILILGVFAMIGCVPSPVVAAGEHEGKTEFHGVYRITSVERYRGGLTSDETARKLIGSSAVIAIDKFMYREKDIANPTYSIECVPAFLGEGNVDSRGLSNFYGFLTDREEICLLRVSDSDGKFIWEFEIIDSEILWDLYDGWIFKLEKTS